MSNLNFNMFGLDKINNVIYHCTHDDWCYGGRAIINGKPMVIIDAGTFNTLRQIMPELEISINDLEKFEKLVCDGETLGVTDGCKAKHELLTKQ